MRVLIHDYETVSLCDLKRHGAWRYSEDVTTDVLCLAYAIDNGPVHVWKPGDSLDELNDLAAAPDVLFTAHNAAFEKSIHRNIMTPFFGLLPVPDARWHDSLARCANLVIPHDLDGATRALRLSNMKDNEASALTIGLSKVDRRGNLPKPTPETMAKVYAYCADDVRAQRELHQRIGFLSREENEVWRLDQRINQRGVRLDMTLIDKMQQIVDQATGPMVTEFAKITGGLKLASPKVKAWCHDRGVHIANLQKDTLTAWLKEEDYDAEDYDTLAGGDEDDGVEVDLPPEVRRALHIKQLVGSASVKKLARARQCVSLDGRARGLLQYHGAGPGLWAGRLLQPQNFPRGTITSYKDEEVESFVARKIDALMTGDAGYVEATIGSPVETVVSSLRHIIVPSPGRELVVGDFAGIQARIALAGAGQHDKTELMASGVDVYIDLACDIFKLPKPEWVKGKEHFKPLVKAFKEQHNEKRQYGKNAVLGLGFQMGAKKFRLRYCGNQPPEFAQGVVDTYRKEWAPKVPKLWYGLDEAACDTVHYRTPHEAYGVLYKLEDMWLTARLPSGRKLYYFNPQPIRKTMPWSTPEAPDVRRAWTYQAKKMGKWVTIDAFGGLLTENFASGLARDLLVTAMFKAERNGLPIVLTVHDEIVADALKRPDNAKVLKQIMEDRPQWAIDMCLPVEAETWAGDRYRK